MATCSLLDQGPPPGLLYLPLGRNASRSSLRGDGVVTRTCGRLLASPPELARSTRVKAIKWLLAVLLVLAVGVLAAGCSGLGSEGKEITLGYIGWDESVAVSTLTKVLLEEELGYEVE